MREHLRGKGRYFRTEAGELLLDWGGDGGDYKTLDFSYVAKCKAGLQKIYGQVRRGEDGVTYDTYDNKVGRKRRVTKGSPTIDKALQAHIAAITGVEDANVTTKGKLAPVPHSIRKELCAVLVEALGRWDDCWQGDTKGWSAERKRKAREAFVRRVWDCGKFYCDSVASNTMVKAVGLLNVEVGAYSELYMRWRGECANGFKGEV